MKYPQILRGCTLLCCLLSCITVRSQHIEQLSQGKPTSIRGLSVVDDSVAWISGSAGYTAITRNGGRTWEWRQVKGFEKADFRDIEAFSDKEAVIMSSGTPALALKTTDGGTSWQVKYRNTDTTYFFDAMDFDTPKHGFILGDPVGGKFLLLETYNGGDTWKPFRNPPDALPGEACFAASGTCLRIQNHLPAIVTGGTAARVITMENNPVNFISSIPLLIKHGKASQGAFSIAFSNKYAVVVGGDYSDDKKTDSVSMYLSTDKIGLAAITPAGFQSCVEYLKGDTFISTGTPGSNITSDGGKTWKKIDNTSFNVCRRARHGKLVILAGNGGKIAKLKM